MTDLQFTDLPAEATVVFMQGPPGVGKTTQAEQLKKMLEGHRAFELEFFQLTKSSSMLMASTSLYLMLSALHTLLKRMS